MLWLLLAAALAAASVLAWWGDTVWLDWQPQRAWPEAWRWWTAALVHWTPMHLGANLLATALVAAYGWAARVPPAVALAWLASWPFTHLALWAKPELLHYGGLSGVLHAGVAAATLWLVLRGAIGRLDGAEGVDSFAFDRLQVQPRRGATAMKVAIDGEIVHLPTPLVFQNAPRPLQLLVPAAADAQERP